MRARYYDPGTGRFVSEDPIGTAGGLNLFAFAGNDPVNNADPDGLNCVRLSRSTVTVCLPVYVRAPRLPTWDPWLVDFGQPVSVINQQAEERGAIPAGQEPDPREREPFDISRRRNARAIAHAERFGTCRTDALEALVSAATDATFVWAYRSMFATGRLLYAGTRMTTAAYMKNMALTTSAVPVSILANNTANRLTGSEGTQWNLGGGASQWAFDNIVKETPYVGTTISVVEAIYSCKGAFFGYPDIR